MKKVFRIFVLAPVVWVLIVAGTFAAEARSEPPPESACQDESIMAIAQTLSGECYDDKLDDKRRVAEVIVNRVSDGRFGATVVSVVTAKGQFHGYWNRNRSISESDIQVAKEILYEWYAGGCESLSEFLYFSAGKNRENRFRIEY